MLSQVQQLGIDPEESDSYVKEAAFALVGAMILFPEVQRKAQEEIDLVTGMERLPGMKDRPQLPYIDRLIQEVLRWRSVVPIGMPHASHRDDIYKGYRIPKGAIVAISQNPNVYKDPETFEPDRFLDPSVAASPAFGFGRRGCPGVHYAQSALYILDENGNDIVPVAEGENKAIFHPVPFKFKLTPRSPLHEQLVQAES
ncbi:hypothetical protein FRC10_004813 [Ceratobasidium sp. 414]|nr:hypothetical protein FRC10_004813 [Ceratobasidium sp. 414]